MNSKYKLTIKSYYFEDTNKHANDYEYIEYIVAMSNNMCIVDIMDKFKRFIWNHRALNNDMSGISIDFLEWIKNNPSKEPNSIFLNSGKTYCSIVNHP